MELTHYLEILLWWARVILLWWARIFLVEELDQADLECSLVYNGEGDFRLGQRSPSMPSPSSIEVREVYVSWFTYGRMHPRGCTSWYPPWPWIGHCYLCCKLVPGGLMP